MTRKVHAVTDGLGNPLRFLISRGNQNDICMAQAMLESFDLNGKLILVDERENGVNRSTLSNWVKQLSPIKVSEEETVTLKEYKALQKEIQRLKIENEI